jgi:F420-dependent oxidoreductase-like protein
MITISAMFEAPRSVSAMIDQATVFAELGIEAGYASQIFGLDALGALGAVGAAVPELDVGTGVVPVYGRHPQALAQQALTTQSAIAGRLTLGIGLSHQVVVEGLWGMSFDRPARYMAEYLEALVPLLNGERAALDGEVLTAKTYGPLEIDAPAPSLLVAALAPVMLQLAGSTTDGTVTWMTGIPTIASYVSPRLSEAAAEAGRPTPRIVSALPVSLTDQPRRAAEQIDKASAIYPTLPSYRAMLDKEGATSASDIGLIGSAELITDGLGRFEDAGGTELVAAPGGTSSERRATLELLGSLAKGARA